MNEYAVGETIFFKDISTLNNMVKGVVVYIGQDHCHAGAELENYYIIEVTTGREGTYRHDKYYAHHMMPYNAETEKQYDVQIQLYNINLEIEALQAKATELQRQQ